MTASGGERGLKVIAYCVLPPAYQMVRAWAERNGHRLVLVVTTPGPPARRSTGYREIVTASPPEQDILVTTRPRRTSPLIAALQPDLVLSFTFPYRLPAEVLSAARLGAVNLHPAPLPRYRGPNPLRALYDGWPTLGAALHRTEAEFDTGPILSLHERPVPADATVETIFRVWSEAMDAALEEGTRRAAAGDAGEAQDETLATYAAPFTEDEHWLDWTLPAALLQLRTVALNMLGPQARAWIGGEAYTLQRVTPTAERSPEAPGAVLRQDGDEFTICAADAVAQVTATAL